MSRRVELIAISCIGALAGLTLLVLALTTNTPVQVVMADSSVSVSITESGFDPTVVTVTIGITVVWINHTQEKVHLMSGEPHRIYLPLVLRNASDTRVTATFPPMVDAVATRQQGNWGNVDIAPGKSYTRTFALADNYPYFLVGYPNRTGLVVVQEAPVPDFALGVQPSSQEVEQGESVTYTVAVTALYGLTDPVALAVDGVPTDAAVSWTTNLLTPTADTTLTITPSMSSPTGTFTLVITGTGGGLVHSTSFTLTVQHHWGDWIVTGIETVEDVTMLLDGNLTVQNGGRLTLRNVSLTLNGTYDGEYGILVQAGGAVTIEAGTVITAASGAGRFAFIAEEGSQFTMRDSALHGCGWGTEYNVPPDPVEPMPISWDLAGLYIQADGAILERNTFSRNFSAIILDAQNSLIDGNCIENNVYNPVVILGSDNIFQDNSMYHVPYSGYSRCLDILGHGNTIDNNTCTTEQENDINVGGIYLLNSWNNIITNNAFTVTNQGISMSTALDASSNNVITGNVILAWESGISIHGCNNLVEGNTISQANTGIEVMYAYDNVIADNIISQIGIMNGIRMTHASGNQVVNNHITTVDSDGILVWNLSQENLFQGNVISATQRGLALFYDCDDNTIRDNVISTIYQAILLDDTSGNQVYRNNFSDANLPPFDDGANQWDDGSQGNYWSDYSGSDGNGDGIGDTPYGIAPTGEDRYPLMEPVTPEAGVVTPLPPVAYQEPLDHINVVTDTVWENQTLTLERYLTVQDGGSLTLRNITMTLGSEIHDAFIWVNPGGALYIYDSHLEGSERGYGGRITLVEGTTLVMENTELQGIRYDWWNGGFEISSDQVTLIGNSLDGVSLQLNPTQSATVISNTISHSVIPLSVGNGEAITIASNIIDGSIWWGLNLSAPEIQDARIVSNVFSDTVGGSISLWEGKAMVIGNTLNHSWGSAIGINSDGNLVSNNIISDFENGISIYGASNNQVVSNTFSHSRRGSVIGVNGNGNLVRNNIISDFGNGISIYGALNNQVISNTLSNGCKGIVLSYSSANTVTHNQLTSLMDDPLIGMNGEAIVLGNSDGNTIALNTVANSSCGALLESDSTNNILFHNNFVSNTVQAWDYCTGNQWDNGGEGNYWSDYAGSDGDGDGIGDTPYVVSPNGVDRYPLMTPYGDVGPTWGNRQPNPRVEPTRSACGSRASR